MTAALQSGEPWPALPFSEWQEANATLHMWTQVVGKIRLALSPPVNHWWHVPLYLTSRGMTTSPIPYGTESFQIDFDFIDHSLPVTTSEGAVRTLELRERSVADFYREVMGALRDLGIQVEIWTTPVEVADPIPFEQDAVHASYDREYARRFFRVLLEADRVLKQFRGGFLGKVSPVQFFWGSFDLAVTRFSGRRAPEHPGGGLLPASITREAYSHEVSSAGFWPGGGGFDAAFYSYAYPEPAGFREVSIRPQGAVYSPELGEYLLPYERIRGAPDPDAALLEFLESTYEAAADLGRWDRAGLER